MKFNFFAILLATAAVSFWILKFGIVVAAKKTSLLSPTPLSFSPLNPSEPQLALTTTEEKKPSMDARRYSTILEMLDESPSPLPYTSSSDPSNWYHPETMDEEEESFMRAILEFLEHGHASPLWPDNDLESTSPPPQCPKTSSPPQCPKSSRPVVRSEEDMEFELAVRNWLRDPEPFVL